MTEDWGDWHRAYDDPGSSLSRRLRVLQGHLRDRLDDTAPAPVRLLSLCAGDGRDLLEVMADRADADRVSGLLVELDPDLAGRAERAAERFPGVRVRAGDAGEVATWADAVPVDLLLLAGVFGNVPDEDVRATVAALPQLCAPGALVLWTRHRGEPDLTPRIRAWFAEAGFEEQDFVGPQDALFGVGAHRFAGATQPLHAEGRLFTFFR